MKKYFEIICILCFCITGVCGIYASNIIYANKNLIIDQASGPGCEVVPILENKIIPTSTGSNIYIHDGISYVKGDLVGNFSLSGYCACTKCGSGTGLTASGHPVRENHTISADWAILPKGTMIILENAKGKDGTSYDGVYEVEDKGGGIKKYKLDIYRPTHELASLVTYYGRCSGDVYIALPCTDERR